MGICRFFLEGRCAYGDQCRNEHPADGGYVEEEEYYEEDPRAGGYSRGGYRGGGSGYRPRYPSSQPRYSTPPRGNNWEPRGGTRFSSPTFHPPQRYDSPNRFQSPQMDAVRPSTDDEILGDVHADIKNMWAQTGSASTVFQQGRIWPFSVYTYCSPDGLLRTDPLFNLNDYSPEELRVSAMIASGNPATLEAHVKEVVAQGNHVRQMFTDICSACESPHTPAGRTVIDEVRKKAAQNEARMRIEGRLGPSPIPSQSTTASSSYGQSQPEMINQPHAANGHSQSNSLGTGVYSDTSMLTAEDFYQFAAPEFTQGKIPYRPPPHNLI